MENLNIRFIYHTLAENESLIKWLMDQGMITNHYICHKCDERMKLNKRKETIDGYSWRCKKEGENGHDVKRSIRKGTWFEDSKLSVRDILGVTFLWLMKATNEHIHRELRVSERSIAEWRNFCREVCMMTIENKNEKLGGPGAIVEIDQSKFGKKKRNQGKQERWVFGGVERGTDKCFMTVVPQCSKDVLLVVIKEHVLPGTTVISDCWKAYDCLEEEGYVHMKLNHDISFEDPATGAQTNSIRGTWGAVKRSFPNGAGENLGNRLYEYIWRRQHKEVDIVTAFYTAVNDLYPPQTHD